MIELTSKQRHSLERAAHSLDPLVIVGQNGVTPSLEEQVGRCLNDHELIKVKFNEFQDDKRELTMQIAEKCDATLIRIIGNIAILYKESDDENKRDISVKFKKGALK